MNTSMNNNNTNIKSARNCFVVKWMDYRVQKELWVICFESVDWSVRPKQTVILEFSKVWVTANKPEIGKVFILYALAEENMQGKQAEAGGANPNYVNSSVHKHETDRSSYSYDAINNANTVSAPTAFKAEQSKNTSALYTAILLQMSAVEFEKRYNRLLAIKQLSEEEKSLMCIGLHDM